MKKADLIDLINRNFEDDDDINFYVYDYEYASGEDDYEDVGSAEIVEVDNKYITFGIHHS
jgi:hypothetical protein